MWLSFILAVFAVYRAARATSAEDGPFDLFASIREWAGQRNWVGRGLQCALCTGVWLALPAALLCQPSTWQEFVLLWGGIAGGAAVIQRLIG